MQKKILKALRGSVVAAAPDLEVVDKPEWANTGTLYVQPKDGFRTVLRIGYDFQDRTATLFLMPGEVPHAPVTDLPAGLRYAAPGEMAGAICPTDARRDACYWTYFEYIDVEKIEAVLAFAAALAGAPARLAS